MAYHFTWALYINHLSLGGFLAKYLSSLEKYFSTESIFNVTAPVSSFWQDFLPAFRVAIDTSLLYRDSGIPLTF